MKTLYSYHFLFKIILYTTITLLGTNGYTQSLENISNYSDDSYFIENKGQEHPDIKYTLKNGGTTLILRENGHSYHTFDYEKYGAILKNTHDNTPNTTDNLIDNHLVHQSFLNTLNPKIRSEKSIKTYHNYIHGNDSTKWGLGIHPCSEVFYDELYKGIDLRYFSKGNGIKYELIVEPRAKPNQISFAYTGQDNLYIDSLGRLVIETSLGNIIEESPFVYQKVGDEIIEIPSRYKLKKGIVTVKIGNYDVNRSLVIDPALIFSTYSGSNADNWGNTACYDSQGNLYAGSTIFAITNAWPPLVLSNGFITTSGAYQTSFRGSLNNPFNNLTVDMGIIKYNSDGTEIIYATYYGGSGSDVPLSMITDQNDDLHLISVTSSPNLHITDAAYQNTFNGGSNINIDYRFTNGTDFYITKLNDTGRPVNSTYFGGNRNDGFTQISEEFQLNYKNRLRADIILDSENNIIITGYTESTTLGVNSFDTSNLSSNEENNTDGIVAKFDSNLENLHWSTYIGGKDDDALYGLALDEFDNIYSCGTTLSNTFTSNSIPSYIRSSQGSSDAMVAKISKDGQTLMGFTRLGTNRQDESYFVQLASNGEVYVTGQSEGNYPVSSSDIYSNVLGGNFIHCLSSDLSTSIFSTKIGSTSASNSGPQLVPTAFLIDTCDRIFLSGWGDKYLNIRRNKGIASFETTEKAYKKTSDGNDFYLAVLAPNAEVLLYGSYFGGTVTEEHLDGGTSRFDPNGVVYQSVCTGCYIRCYSNGDCETSQSNNYPLYPTISTGSSPRQKGIGSCNSAVFKFDLAGAKAEIGLDKECQSNLAYFHNNSEASTGFEWNFGDGTPPIFTNEVTTQSHLYAKNGTYTVTLKSQSIYGCSVELIDSAVVFITSVLDTKTDYDTICSPQLIQPNMYTDTLGFFYEWTNTNQDELVNNMVANPSLEVNKTKEYYIKISDSLDCFRYDTFALTYPEISINIEQITKQSCEKNLAGTLKFINNSRLTGSNTNLTYLWNFNNEAQTSAKIPESRTYIKADTIVTQVRLSSGKCFIDTSLHAVFTDISYPNIITPNHDGLNDNYIIEGINSDNWKLTITNRWGKIIYKNENYHNEFNAEGLKDGTYFFLIESPDDKRCKGWLQIVK